MTVEPVSEKRREEVKRISDALENFNLEEFEKKQKEKQERCKHDEKVYSFGPTLDGSLDVQTYSCGTCGLQTMEPIGRYKGTKPMNRNDLNRMIRNTYVD